MREVWAAVIGAVGRVAAAVIKAIFGDERGDPPGGSFSVVLLMVDRNGHRAIEEWLARGRRGEGFPGMEEVPGSVKLSVVRQLVLDDA